MNGPSGLKCSTSGTANGVCGLLILSAIAEDNQSVYVPAVWTRYIKDHLLPRFGRVIVAGVVVDATNGNHHKGVELSSLGPCVQVQAINRLPGGRNAPGSVRAIALVWSLWRFAGAVTCAAVMLPGFKGSLAALFLRLRRKIYWVHVVGPVRVRSGALRVVDSLRVAADRVATAGARFAIVSGPVLQQEILPLNARTVLQKPQSTLLCPLPRAAERGGLHTPLRCLYVGSLFPDKRVEDLVTAIHMLRQRYDIDAELWLAGDGPTVPIGRLIVQLGLGERVRVLGFLQPESLAELYREADVFLFASVNEGLPRAVLEAMAFGLPVVTTAVGSLAQLLHDRTSALIVHDRSPSEIAASVSLLVASDSLRELLSTEGRALVEKTMSATLPSPVETALNQWLA